MRSFRVDLSAFQRISRVLGALDETQMPFALAGALNATAEIGRRTLIDETWPRHVDARNKTFMRAALSTKGTRATKRNLRVVVYDRLGRANFVQHERGGSKKPRGTNLAIPSAALQARRTSKGVPKGLRPRNLPTTGPNGTFIQGDVLYQRVGTGKTRGRRLMYVMKRSVPIKGDVPFHEDFGCAVRRAFPGQFRKAMRRAMSTAIRK